VSPRRRLFERLQQGLRGRERHPLGVVQDEHLAARLVGGERGHTLDLSDLLDPDHRRALGVVPGRRGRDDLAVRVLAGRHAPARRARPAPLRRAERGLGERDRSEATPDARGADERVGVRQPVGRDRALEQGDRG
jgi:hypothetical protein